MKYREGPDQNTLDFPVLTEMQLEDLYEGELPEGKEALVRFPVIMSATMLCPQNTLPEGESFQSNHPRGFVFAPAGLELLALQDDGPDTLRFARTEIIDLYDGSNRLRGMDIIPNLVAQLKALRKSLQDTESQCASYVDVHEGNTYIAVYHLPENGEWISKHYINPATGEHSVVFLTDDDKLFIPRFKEHGNISALRVHLLEMIERDCYAGRTGLKALELCVRGDNAAVARARMRRSFPGVTDDDFSALWAELSLRMGELECRCIERDAQFETSPLSVDGDALDEMLMDFLRRLHETGAVVMVLRKDVAVPIEFDPKKLN